MGCHGFVVSGARIVGSAWRAQLEAFWCCLKLILGAAAESFEKRHFLRRGGGKRNFFSPTFPCSVVFFFKKSINGYFFVRPGLVFWVIKVALGSGGAVGTLR